MRWKPNLTASYHYLSRSMFLDHFFNLITSDGSRTVNLLLSLDSVCASGERDGVEIISAGASRLSRDPDRTSTGSVQFTGSRSCSLLSVCLRQQFSWLCEWLSCDDCNYSSLDKESNSSSRSALQSSPIGSNPFEEEKKDEEEEEGFEDPELPYQVAEVDREGDLFDVFPSRAEEALKTRKDTRENNRIQPCLFRKKIN